MKTISQLVAIIGLLAVIVPCFLIYFGMMDLNLVKTTTLIGTVVWFIAAPAWMKSSP